MKRVLTILTILLLPLSVWAMTPVNDSDLSNVTGQAGFSMTADVAMNIHMDTMAWGDQDGLGTSGVHTGNTGLNPWGAATDGGFVGIKNFDMQLRIKSRGTDNYNGFNTLNIHGPGTIAASGPVAAKWNANWHGYPGLRPLTIDVATATGVAGTSGAPYGNGTTFVRIGLGAMEIGVNALQFDVALSPRPTSGAPALNQVLGTVSMGAIGVYVNPNSYIDIYNNRPGGVTGVSFTMDIIIDQFNMNYISWGNNGGFVNHDFADPTIWSTTPIYVQQFGGAWTVIAGAVGGLAGGYGGTGVGGFPWATTVTAGYVGLFNLQVGGPITITGTVNIDVGTVTAGYYATAANHLTSGFDSQLPMVQITFGQNAYANYGPSQTGGVVNWNDLGLKITVPLITAEVRIADNYQLVAGNATPTCNTLGDIYLSNFNLNIVKGSWVDIFAH